MQEVFVDGKTSGFAVLEGNLAKRKRRHPKELVTTNWALQQDYPPLQLNGLDQNTIRVQLSALLRSELLRNSERCTQFLQYVVEATLRGEASCLKERTIGVEVFGRSPLYDTSTDNVVRDTAAEVRSRLALYYAQAGHSSELRIELFKGSYVPRFESGVSNKPAISLADVPHWALAAFWGPLVDSAHPVRIGIGSSNTGGKSGAAGPLSRRAWLANQVVFHDAECVFKVALLLQGMQQQSRIQKHTEIRFQDLCSAPAVLVGGYNNQWTLRFTKQLRYRLRGRPAGRKTWIEDSESPSDHSRMVDWSSSTLPTIEDYSIIARALDSETGQMTVAIGGQTWYGTAAAGEFLTSEACLSELFGRVSERDRRSTNIEAILSTKVVRGISFPPKLMDVHVW